MCFSNRLTIHKVIIKVYHSSVVKNGRAIATFFKFCVSRRSATRLLRNGEKYIYFIDNLSLVLTMKEFSKLVNS